MAGNGTSKTLKATPLVALIEYLRVFVFVSATVNITLCCKAMIR